MSTKRLAAAIPLAILALWAPEPAAAQTCAFPGFIRISAARAAHQPIVVTWAFGLPSPGGEVRDVATGALLQSLGPLPSGVQKETIVLPPGTIQTLIQSGSRRLSIFRVGEVGCNVIVEYGGPLGGALDIQRIQLRFDAGSPLRIVPIEGELKAWADLVYSGSGEFVARWEVAGPESTSSAPQFTVLERVRRHIGGGGRVSIESPDLPTDRAGLFLVRLKIEEERIRALFPNFDEPTLRYYVTEAGDARRAPTVIDVHEPRHQGELHADTLFRWEPVDGARAYRIELHPYEALERRHVRFDAGNPSFTDLRSAGARRQTHESFGPTMGPAPAPMPEGKPLAGVTVKAGTSEARLSAWAFDELRPGRDYVFVVRAIAEAGIPIGLSAPRVVRVRADARTGEP